MQEIFDKAREYARQGMGQNLHLVTAKRLEAEHKVGEWRLHQQAFKVLEIAVDRCAKERLKHPQKESEQPISIGEVVEEINCMECKYGVGWSHEGPWYIKDYRAPQELVDTLGFFDRMGVKYTREDTNDTKQSVHLRVSEHDFDLIFNPEQDYAHTPNRAPRQGRG